MNRQALHFKLARRRVYKMSSIEGIGPIDKFFAERVPSGGKLELAVEAQVRVARKHTLSKDELG
jgi:hypothetical protein